MDGVLGKVLRRQTPLQLKGCADPTVDHLPAAWQLAWSTSYEAGMRLMASTEY